ncbi:MAG: hypothetical protein LBF33_02095 [Oscillospiraceae bacterium]|jgi:phage regulator Rha-like protein|nr:hypothetical protein [Oscillospiraceae bacterium]
MSNELVFIKRNEMFITSKTIAMDANIKHKNIKKLILKYEIKLEMFGKVPFEMEASKSGQHEKIYFLSEPQEHF